MFFYDNLRKNTKVRNRRMHNFLDFISSPIKALYSVSFYFEVLFKKRGQGILFLLYISVLVSIPSTIKLYSKISYHLEKDIVYVASQIPKTYLDSNGTLRAYDKQQSFKQIYTQDGVLAVVFNIEDIMYESDNEPVIEFNSKTFRLNYANGTVLRYVDSLGPKGSLNDLLEPYTIKSIADMANVFAFLVYSIAAFIMLGLNVFFTAALSSFFFTVVGKIKTSFSNLLRLSCYANTVCALVLIVQSLFDVTFSYFVMMLLPMIYMILFVKTFHNELLNNGIEGFIKNHDLKNAKVVGKKYDSNGNLESSEDLLNNESDKLKSSNGESSDTDNNDKNNKSGYFAP